MIIQFKHVHNSLNIVEVLVPDCKFFYAKCDQFPLAITK